MSATKDKMKGKAKQVVGRVTKNQRMEVEGVALHARGVARGVAKDTKRALKRATRKHEAR